MKDYIDVPVLEIKDGWTVDDLNTLEDCEDAFIVLTALIVAIEARIDDLDAGNGIQKDELKRAKGALKFKKAALQIVSLKRGRITRQEKERKQLSWDRRVVDYFSAMHPKEFERARKHVDAGTEHLAGSGEG